MLSAVGISADGCVEKGDCLARFVETVLQKITELSVAEDHWGVVGLKVEASAAAAAFRTSRPSIACQHIFASRGESHSKYSCAKMQSSTM